MLWRVWKEGKDSLYDLTNNWTYEQLLKANAVLDMHQTLDIVNDEYLDQEMKVPGEK